MKIQKKKFIYFFFLGGGGGPGGGSGGGSGWWVSWVRVDVNAKFGVGGDVGYGGCEPRVEGIVQGTKKVLYNIKKKNGGGGEGQYLNQKHSLCIQKRKRKKK